jgi:hypothetical protein
VNTGIKALLKAPSAKSFLKLLGMLNVKLITSPIPLAPKYVARTRALTIPNKRETNVKTMRIREFLFTL